MEQANFFPYIAFLSALIALALTMYAWGKRREVVGAPAFAAVTSGLAIWSAAYGLELAAGALETKIVWARLAYFGAVMVPGTWLACVRRYAGRPPLSRQATVLLAIEPLAVLALLFTNEHHHLFWAKLVLETQDRWPQLVVDYGPGAWANVTYAYVLLAVSGFVLVKKIVRASSVYRTQSSVLLLGVSAPWVAHIAYVLGYEPLPGLELTPFAFTVSGLAMAFALFRLGIFEVMPVAQGVIVERIRDGIIVVNRIGLVVHVNPAAEAMFGVDAQSAVGRPALEVFAGAAELASRFVAGDIEGEVWIAAGDERKIFDVRVCSLGGQPGPQRGRLIVVRDVTEAKRAELALLLARDQAVAAARSKADFLATMSHEIRTPMNGVIGTTEVLLGTRLDHDQRDLANTIRSCADALLGIINSVLDFSKIEAGRLDLEAVDFDLRLLVEDVVELFGPRARNQGIELVSSSQETIPCCLRGDAGRLRQVLTNLISNAVKFTAKGSVMVRCETMDHTDGRLWLRIKVIDTGIGIDDEQRKLLFEPFVQADSSHTRRYGGTGLGLAISKRLVELMGGEILLSSRPGSGSTFTVVVPFDAGAGRAPGAPASRQTSAQPEPETRADHPPVASPAVEATSALAVAPARILIVEDNIVNQKLAARMLADLGHATDIAANGVEALGALRRSKYDLVLMDCQMPVMDGFQATTEIRGLEAGGRHVPIVAMTANAMEGDRERCLESGMDDYIAKPVRPADLAGLLSKWLPPTSEERGAVAS